MPEITIPASEVRGGDVISFGGWGRIVSVASQGQAGVTIYLDPTGVIYDTPADLPLTVDRPDPDAELIEAMAQAIAESDGNPWPMASATTTAAYRDNAGAALDAYREHNRPVVL